MSTIQTINIKNASSSVNNIVLGTDGSVTSQGTIAMATPFAMRNKIINGAMEIDQRNAGAAQNNVASAATYCLDRFSYYGTTGARFSIGQNVGSVTPPAGFINYLGISSLAATTPASTDLYAVGQRIEGLNIADLAWGSANAKTVTLSFWVRSSLTGTFGGVFFNSAGTRGYAYSYTINAVNTWEYKTVTVPGDTTGTWLTTNGTGITIWFNFASGASQLKTPGVWDGTAAYGPTGAVNVLSSVGGYLYITGVQLEVGTVATPFERRLYPQELAMCQRYYEVSDNQNTSLFWSGGVSSGSTYYLPVKFVVTKRANATVSITDVLNSGFTAAVTVGEQSAVGFRSQAAANTTNAGSNYFRSNWQASAEL